MAQAIAKLVQIIALRSFRFMEYEIQGTEKVHVDTRIIERDEVLQGDRDFARDVVANNKAVLVADGSAGQEQIAEAKARRAAREKAQAAAAKKAAEAPTGEEYIAAIVARTVAATLEQLKAPAAS